VAFAGVVGAVFAAIAVVFVVFVEAAKKKHVHTRDSTSLRKDPATVSNTQAFSPKKTYHSPSSKSIRTVVPSCHTPSSQCQSQCTFKINYISQQNQGNVLGEVSSVVTELDEKNQKVILPARLRWGGPGEIERALHCCLKLKSRRCFHESMWVKLAMKLTRTIALLSPYH